MDKLEGEWISADSKISQSISFKSDNTGTMTALGVTVDTKFTLEKDVLIITYDILGKEQKDRYSVSFNEKEHLILTNDDGTAEEYIKK